MKTRLFKAILMLATASGLAAQVSEETCVISEITPAPTNDMVTAQGAKPARQTTRNYGRLFTEIVTVDIYAQQTNIYQTVWVANPAAAMSGFLIGNGGVCQQPASIARRTFTFFDTATVNGVDDVHVPGIGSEVSANWIYTYPSGQPVTFRLHDQVNVTCDGAE